VKIQHHPRVLEIVVGDEVYSYVHDLFARVEAVFPAAVCVRVPLLDQRFGIVVRWEPQLWCADDIELLSVCRYCGERDGLRPETDTGVPFRTCDRCSTVSLRDAAHEVGQWWA
jgi:hypothetical protein